MKRLISILTVIITVGYLVYSQAIVPNSSDANQKKIEKIIVYGSDSCHYCTDTKKFLKKNGVSFIYYDVDQNQPKLNEMITKLLKNQISLDNVSLPVIDRDGKITMNSGDFDTFLKTLIVKK